MGRKPLGERALTNAEKQRRYRERLKAPRVYKTPPAKKPSTHIKGGRKGGLSLIVGVVSWVQDIKAADKTFDRITGQLEQNLPGLHSEEIDYLVDISLTLAEKVRKFADVARKLQSDKRTHIQLVGQDG